MYRVKVKFKRSCQLPFVKVASTSVASGPILFLVPRKEKRTANWFTYIGLLLAFSLVLSLSFLLPVPISGPEGVHFPHSTLCSLYGSSFCLFRTLSLSLSLSLSVPSDWWPGQARSVTLASRKKGTREKRA